MSLSFAARAAKKTGKYYDFAPDSASVSINTVLLQELIDLAEAESDEDDEGVFTFDWMDHAGSAEISQTPTAKDCRKPHDMLDVLLILKRRSDANPETYKGYAAYIAKMIALCEDAEKTGLLIHTTIT